MQKRGTLKLKRMTRKKATFVSLGFLVCFFVFLFLFYIAISQIISFCSSFASRINFSLPDFMKVTMKSKHNAIYLLISRFHIFSQSCSNNPCGCNRNESCTDYNSVSCLLEMASGVQISTISTQVKCLLVSKTLTQNLEI